MNESVLARSARRRARVPATGRRRFLKSALGALIVLPAGGTFAAPGAGPAPLPGAPVARYQDGCFLVENWILTEADLRALGIAVPGPAGSGARRPSEGARA